MSDSPTLISDRYRLGLLLGNGATGRVFAGVDAQSGEHVAIKWLREEVVAQMPELLERFRREGEALRRLNHPNIVKVLATVEQDGQHYIIMEHVAGGSLADLLKREKRLPVERVVAMGLELSDALSRAHHLGIIHRDIKPGNILLDDNGSPRLTDFGLAHIGSLPAVTVAGALLGTIPYLSPEGCSYQPLDERADLWSFGVVLYEALAGQRPFDGDTPASIIRAILDQPAPDVTWYRKDTPPELAQLIGRMLMKDRPARTASARLVGVELEAIQRGTKRPVVPTAQQTPAPLPTHPRAQISVIIADDHAVVRQGLRTFLELQDDILIVGEAADGAEAVTQVARLKPDIVLLDLVMPHMDGVEATRRIAQDNPETRVIILTSFGEDSKVFPAIRAGAQGYLLKDIPPDELAQAVREVHGGKAHLHPDIVRRLMSAVTKQDAIPSPPDSVPASPVAPRSPGEDELTEREREVLQLIAQGLNNREIAERMVISEKTVKTHVSNILGKLHLDDRTQAAIYALKRGLAGSSQ